jgi:ABC-type transporter Mla subunit MlaD
VEAWIIAGVVLVAVLVGAAVPVLIQLSMTLRQARLTLDRTGRRVDRALEEITEAAARLNRVGSGLEESAGRLKELFDSAAQFRHALDRLRDNLNVVVALGAAVGPAIAAALGALRSTGDREEQAPADPATEPAAAPGEALRAVGSGGRRVQRERGEEEKR